MVYSITRQSILQDNNTTPRNGSINGFNMVIYRKREMSEKMRNELQKTPQVFDNITCKYLRVKYFLQPQWVCNQSCYNLSGVVINVYAIRKILPCNQSCYNLSGVVINVYAICIIVMCRYLRVNTVYNLSGVVINGDAICKILPCNQWSCYMSLQLNVYFQFLSFFFF